MEIYIKRDDPAKFIIEFKRLLIWYRINGSEFDAKIKQVSFFFFGLLKKINDN